MNATVCTYKNNRNFWIFGAFFFLYFFIMATCFPFLPIWLSEVIGLNKTETGLVFSCLSLFAILFQPIFGIISDKLGLKKHLLWVITLLLFFFAPFFLYVFAPLLKMNVLLGAMVGGAYIGFAFQGAQEPLRLISNESAAKVPSNTARRGCLAVSAGGSVRLPPGCYSISIRISSSGWDLGPQYY